MRGFRDVLPPLSYKFNYVKRIFEKFSSKYAVDLIDLNHVEESDLYYRTSGEESEICNKELFEVRKFKSDYEGWVLRPEGTASCIKLVKDNNFLEGRKEARLGYYGAMFRYNRPQKGRYRQFIQAGWEWLGSNNKYLDYEMLSALCDLLSFLKIDYTLEINSIGNFEDRFKYRNELKSLLNIETDPFKVLDKLDTFQNIPEMHLNSLDQEVYNFVLDKLSCLGINYKHNPYLVRGLDYYNGLVFEFKVNNQTILGGGRYDGLMEQLNGSHVPAIGFAIGVDRVVDILEHSIVSKKVAVINLDSQEYCLEILKKLREHDISSFPYWGYDLSKALKLASKECSHAIIIGSKEEKDRTFILRDFKNSLQYEKSFDDISELNAGILQL